MVDYGPQAPINTTSHSSTVQMGVSHARCCLLMHMSGSVVTLCSLHVLLSTWYMSGLCDHERAKNRQTFTCRYVRVVQNKDAQHTAHTSCTAQQKREAVLTDDGP